MAKVLELNFRDFLFFNRIETNLQCSKYKLRKGENMEKSSIQVLVVDDDEINILISRKVLSKYFSHVEFETDSTLALEKILAKRFDIVLLDVNMPVMNGFDVVSHIRSQEDTYFKQLPIIANTASILPEDIEEILNSGFTSYQSKPLRIDVLLREIDKLMVNVHT